MSIKRNLFPILPLLAWSFYDWGNSAFSAIIQTFIFASYFTEQVAHNPLSGSILWGWINGGAAIIVGILAPFLGAIADHGGKRKEWLAFFTILNVISTALLWFATPHSPFLFLIIALTSLGIISSELAFVFYNAMLPTLTSPSKIGRWSAWGWGLGYAGGMCSLIFSLFLFILPEEGAPHSLRMTFLFAAMWNGLFSLPLFFYVPNTKSESKNILSAIQKGTRELKKTFLEIKKYREIVKFLMARFFYVDGLATLFAFGGVYAAHTFRMNPTEILIFGIMMHVSAGLGCVFFAKVDDLIGPKWLILFSLTGLTIPFLFLLFTSNKSIFFLGGALLGIFVGPVQSASRSLMARLAPYHLCNEMFGFFILSGKATGFIGPMFVSWILLQTESQQTAFSLVPLLFILGASILLTVKEKV